MMFKNLSFTLLLIVALVACSKKSDPKSSLKAITTFSFNALSPSIVATIDETNKTITATLPVGTDLTKLIPTITTSPLAILSPLSGVMQDFSAAKTYTVTAEDGSISVYTVKITRTKSTAKSIKSFVFNGLTPAVTATIDSVQHTITATLPAGTDLTKLVPTISTTGVSISPASGVAQDFSKAVNYTVTAEDGSTQNYLVTMKVAIVVISNDNKNGTVYVSSSESGTLYALDLLTGVKKWEFTSIYKGLTSPTYANNILYVGGNYYLFAIDVSNGVLKWKVDTGYQNPPMYNNGFIFGSDASINYAFDINGNKIWENFMPGYYNPKSTFYNDKIYFGTSSGINDAALYCINAKTGASIWKKALTSDKKEYIKPVVVNGILYSGDRSGNFFALDLATENILWSKKVAANLGLNNIDTNIEVDNSTIYFSNNGRFLAYNSKDGSLKWQYDENYNSFGLSPISANGYVFFTDVKGKFYALDATTGKEKWTIQLDSPNSYSNPCVSGNVVLIGGKNKFYAFDIATGNKLWEFVSDNGYWGSACVVDKGGKVYFSAENGTPRY